MADGAAFAPDLILLAERAAGRVGDSRLGADILKLVREHAPDERLALAFILKLAEESPAELRAALIDADLSSGLVFCLGGSELIATGLAAMGPRWWRFFQEVAACEGAALMSGVRCTLDDGAERKAMEEGLARFKRETFLRIAIADLLGRSTVVDTMTAMSQLADDCVQAALAAALAILGPRGAAVGQFCAVAMGKLGASELNLSSDIDLIYLFDGPDQHAAARLGEVLSELLSNNCFRIDLRLRPGGRNSPLVASFESALGFYQAYGQTWERAALLRARPIAGAIALGERLLAELDRFVYRRYLDFETLRQLRAMKRQIEAELGPTGMVERNIKLGYGGIRELEFIVQALTLIYGGRDPRLRTHRTLEALERLDALGYLASRHAQRLASTYLFLRDVEHKLQVAAGLQTHSLPADERAIAVVAARLHLGKGPRAAERLQIALRQHREFVANQFRETLAGGEGRKLEASDNAQAAWRAALDPEAAAIILQRLGFANPNESAGHLTMLARGPAHIPASSRRHELVDQLGPVLLDEIALLPDPDLALMNLADFIAAVGAHTSFLSLLEQHPGTRQVLLRLFASSRYLSSLFIRHPELLDTLVRSDLARVRRNPDDLSRDLSGLVDASRDFEARLDAVRSFRHQEFLRVAIADLAGMLRLDEVQTELTSLAEVVLREALTIATAEVALHRPIPSTLKLCVIGMGRLGAGEMSYNSDLDLIFIYHDQHEIAGGSREIASRIAQKIVAILETRTREGYAYKLDLRLRPSGKAGPLVTSMAGFREYHSTSAAVWERQTLVRARVVAGDDQLDAEFEQARREFVFDRVLSATEVGEIATMRQRMERELGAEDGRRLNLKQGPGGLVDVEFVTQMMAMRHGGRFAELTGRAVVGLIRALAARGLMSAEDAAHLEADYHFLAQLENRLRIETDQAAWALPTAPAELTPLARRMGYEGEGGAQRMFDELVVHRQRIRTIFERYFAAEQQAAG
jgi:glutamate-ammonia-ligase adenylyltransferase